MIIHIDAFTYIDEWDEKIKEVEEGIEDFFEEVEDFDDYESSYTDLLGEDERHYDMIEFESPRMPTIYEMMHDLRCEPQTLFILWIEDEEAGIHKYIMKDTYEHCIGFLEGARYCGDHTGVYITPLMDLTNIRMGLMAADTFVDVNNFFNYEVFGKDI